MAKGKTIALLIIGAILVIVGIWLLVSWNDMHDVIAAYNAGLDLCSGNATCIGILQKLYDGDIAAKGMLYLIGGISSIVVGGIVIIVGIKS